MGCRKGQGIPLTPKDARELVCCKGWETGTTELWARSGQSSFQLASENIVCVLYSPHSAHGHRWVCEGMAGPVLTEQGCGCSWIQLPASPPSLPPSHPARMRLRMRRGHVSRCLENGPGLPEKPLAGCQEPLTRSARLAIDGASFPGTSRPRPAHQQLNVQHPAPNSGASHLM